MLVCSVHVGVYANIYSVYYTLYLYSAESVLWIQCKFEYIFLLVMAVAFADVTATAATCVPCTTSPFMRILLFEYQNLYFHFSIGINLLRIFVTTPQCILIHKTESTTTTTTKTISIPTTRPKLAKNVRRMHLLHIHATLNALSLHFNYCSCRFRIHTFPFRPRSMCSHEDG